MDDDSCVTPKLWNIDISDYGWRAVNWRFIEKAGTCSIDSYTDTSVVVSCLRTQYCDYIPPSDIEGTYGGSVVMSDMIIRFDRVFGRSCNGDLRSTGDDVSRIRNITVLDGNYYSFNDGKILRCVDGDFIIVDDCASKGMAIDREFGVVVNPSTGDATPRKCVSGCGLTNGLYIRDGSLMCRDGTNLERCNAATNTWTVAVDCATSYNSYCLPNEQTWCMNIWASVQRCDYRTVAGSSYQQGSAAWGQVKCFGIGDAVLKRCTGNDVWEEVVTCASKKCLTSNFCEAPVPKPPNPSPMIHFSWLKDKFSSFINKLKLVF